MFGSEIIGYQHDRIDDTVVYDYGTAGTAIKIIRAPEAQNEKADG